MQAFGHYILRKPSHALGLIVVCTVIPLMGWLASIILGLITLCKPTKDSVVALSVLLLANVADVSWLVLYHHTSSFLASMTLINSGLFGGIVLWCMALLLRHSERRWTIVMLFALGAGLPVLIMAYLYLPELTNGLSAWLDNTIKYFLYESQHVLTSHQQMYVTHAWSYLHHCLAMPKLVIYLLGTVITMLFYGLGMAQLFIARWWQSRLFADSIHVREELLTVRIPWQLSTVFVTGLAALFITNSTILYGALPLTVIVWLIAGLSVIHALVQHRSLAKLWLLLIYIGLFAVSDIMISLVLLAACVDSVVNLRQRVAAPTSLNMR